MAELFKRTAKNVETGKGAEDIVPVKAETEIHGFPEFAARLRRHMNSYPENSFAGNLAAMRADLSLELAENAHDVAALHHVEAGSSSIPMHAKDSMARMFAYYIKSLQEKTSLQEK